MSRRGRQPESGKRLANRLKGIRTSQRPIPAKRVKGICGYR